jgi:alkanesulfonate monooxygenase SsuD/methylene tetrahydromethanopterin reductase-like flavin-dependent oxidoreductase (luciferase family)
LPGFVASFRQACPGRAELGVVTHGRDSESLGAAMLDSLHHWDDAGRPDTPTVIVRRGTGSPVTPGDIVRSNCTIKVSFPARR